MVLHAVARFRRAAPLACYWLNGQLVAHNYATGRRAAAPALALEILDFCRDWRTLDDVFAGFGVYDRAPLRRLLSLLVKHTLLERSVTALSSASDRLFATWRTWTPEAAFFHFATKDTGYGPQDEMDRRLVEKAESEPPPPPIKIYPGAHRTPLPAVADTHPIAPVLRERRTWRHFGEEAVALSDVATLLGLTWGVQTWIQTQVGSCALKTSPSDGARHPIEAYLLARRVTGLAAACYHYDPDAHELTLVKPGLSAERFARYMPDQSFYHDAAALVIMTAIFARAQWRYERPRAYRAVLFDAGHLCQTFCLVATALGLAPFCTAALADSVIETDLGLDGITESVIYACGVGTRPSGVDRTSAADAQKYPALVPPKSGR